MNVSKKPLDNLTTQQKSEQQKHLGEMGKDGKFEGRRHTESGQNGNVHYGNPRKWGLDYHHFEFIVGKGENETLTGDTDIDGSGDMGQVDTYHGVTIDREDHDPGKERQDMRGLGYDRLLGKDKDSKSGLSGDGKPSKGALIKTGEKKSDTRIIQDVSSNSSFSPKSKDPQSKVYSKILVNGTTDATHKMSGSEDGGDADLLDKTKDHAAVSVHTHLRGHGHISIPHSRKIENIRSGRNNTRSSDTDEIKTANGKIVKIKMEKKGADTMSSRKLNEEDRFGVTKPVPKGEVRDLSFSGRHVEVAGAVKRDGGKEGVIKGRPSSPREATGDSKTHQNTTGEADITSRLSNQKDNPVYTTIGKTGQQEVMLRGQLTDGVSGSGVTKPHPKVKDKVTILKTISGSRVSGLGSVQESRKGDHHMGIVHRKSDVDKEGFDFASTHSKEVGNREKINRKTQEAPKVPEKGKNRFGFIFQEANQDTGKGDTENRKPIGMTPDLKKGDVNSFNRKAGQKSIGIKSGLSLYPGSHRDALKHGPRKDDLKSPEHSSSIYKKVTKISKQTSKVTTGTDGGTMVKKHHGHSGIWRRKSRRLDKKKKSVKRAHGSDSSQSSESDEDSRHDSHRSYRDYQNDTPDSHQSLESMETNLSEESNQSDDDRSQMEDRDIYSQESSHEHK